MNRMPKCISARADNLRDAISILRVAFGQRDATATIRRSGATYAVTVVGGPEPAT